MLLRSPPPFPFISTHIYRDDRVPIYRIEWTRSPLEWKLSRTHRQWPRHHPPSCQCPCSCYAYTHHIALLSAVSIKGRRPRLGHDSMRGEMKWVAVATCAACLLPRQMFQSVRLFSLFEKAFHAIIQHFCIAWAAASAGQTGPLLAAVNSLFIKQYDDDGSHNPHTRHTWHFHGKRFCRLIRVGCGSTHCLCLKSRGNIKIRNGGIWRHGAGEITEFISEFWEV